MALRTPVMTARRRRVAPCWRFTTLLTLMLLAPLPQPARADVTCGFSEVDGVMMMIVFFSPGVTLGRSGEVITVDGEPCLDPATGAPQPTVTNTGRIDLSSQTGGGWLSVISLANGPFAPGTETGASPEIFIDFTPGDNVCDPLRIEGSTGADHLRWGSEQSREWGNLNADETDEIDADFRVEAGCISLRIVAAAGADEISAAGGLGTGTMARYPIRVLGGDGRDVLTGGQASDTLLGDASADVVAGRDGNDRLVGGDGNDRLSGGLGADTLLGLRGRDGITGGADDDVIDGGPGFDICKGGPGRDRILRCEA
jgi:Ca2+-binding RTX toxin-like protein